MTDRTVGPEHSAGQERRPGHTIAVLARTRPGVDPRGWCRCVPSRRTAIPLVRRARPPRRSCRVEVMTTLDVVGLRKSFGGVRALSDVQMLMPGGKITGIIGPNGAGKSTLVNV